MSLSAGSTCKCVIMHLLCAGLGDVAVTPFSVNWQCKLASWTEQCTNFPNVCTYPIEDAGPTVTCESLSPITHTAHLVHVLSFVLYFEALAFKRA